MRTLIALFLFLPIVAGCATPSQIMLDAEVKRLCAVDGGIKVYETVRLSPETLAKFTKYKYGSMPIPPIENMNPQDDFYYKLTTQYLYKNGSDYEGTNLVRYHYELYRSQDNKLLGEAISYTRRGGDVPGPWHPSHFTCPAPTLSLFERVFSIPQGDTK